MKIIISPAKKMTVDTNSLPPLEMPVFLEDAKTLLRELRTKDYAALKKLWNCSHEIADLNYDRIQNMQLETNLTPAILSYEGIQYTHMAPAVFATEQYHYIEDHLRILSGFYGILRPFDGIVPYRLEMQAKLKVAPYKDLYDFWGDRIAASLTAEDNIIVNLASKEYSKCVSAHLTPKTTFLTCTFGEIKEDKILQKGTQCKMARGAMVRFMAENQVSNIEELKDFNDSGYHYTAALSEKNHFVFIKE